jgi:putative DNA primase/helicase
MMNDSNIFAKYAPLYWAAGVPVMPLKKRSKAPILNEWSNYGTNFPSVAVRDHWLQAYPDSNIGLPFGEASGLSAIDIDTVDDNLTELIMDCLPASPWVRVGKKGCGLIFRWKGQSNFKIRSEDGMLCEHLGKGNQLVMPGSVHPDCSACGEKNVAGPKGLCISCGTPSIVYGSNTNLWEVMDKIQLLPLDIEERLRDALGVKGMKLAHEGRSAPMIVVPQGERDIQLVRHAGYLARVVLGIDRNARFGLAEAMQHMYTWVEQFTSGAAGDDMDPEKGVSKLIEFLLKDVENGKTLPHGWDTGLTADQLLHPAIAAMIAANEIIRWTPARARDWLRENCELKPDDNDWAVAKVDELLRHLAADDHFTDFQLESLMKDFVSWIGTGVLSKPVIKKLFKDARAGRAQDEELDEDHEAIAVRVLEIINRDGELRFSNGAFWQWNGSCFVVLSDQEITKTVMKVKGNVLSRRAADYKAVTSVIKILCERKLMEDVAQGVNFANGFLDMDGELHDHAPRFGQTFTMPFNYEPTKVNEAHKWFAFLERIWGDDDDYADKVNALQEAFAVTMFGNAPSFQRAILLYGRAATGKSTILNVLRAMMPPAAVSSVAPHKWGQRFTMVAMVGKTLNCCGELSEHTPISGDVFKEVVEGTPQETEFKGQDGFSFKPVAAHWFASNFLPYSRDGSQGFLRRWLVLYFGNPMEGAEIVRDYHDVLVSDEREAIAAWAIAGMSRLRAQRDFTLPRSHHTHLNSVHRANNSVAAWVQTSDKVFATEDKTVWADAVAAYDLYGWFMKDVSGMGMRGLINFERFKQMMGELNHKVEEYSDVLGVIRFKIMGIRLTVPAIVN